MADNPAAGTDQAQSGGTGREIVIYDPAKLARDQQAVESGFWKKVRRFASKLPFLDELLAAYYCATDPATPLQVKAILYGALAYFIMPIDLIPDFVPVFGLLDDVVVIGMVVHWLIGRLPFDVREDARAHVFTQRA